MFEAENSQNYKNIQPGSKKPSSYKVKKMYEKIYCLRLYETILFLLNTLNRNA